MEKRTLGKTDMTVSAVGFGGIPIQGVSFEETERILMTAIGRGVNFFDSARAYTDSEEKMGRAFAGGARGGIYLSSKALSRTAAEMAKELETSLRNLRTDMIDLYQLHSVGTSADLDRVLAPGGAYEALVAAREEGKIRWIGITGHSREIMLRAIRTGLFDTAQFPFNPIETEWEEEIIPAARAARVGTICMKPFAGGAIRSRALALRFELTRGMDVVIPGMDAVAQVEENAAVGGRIAPLEAAELAALEAERRLWGGKFCRRCGYCLPCPNGLNIPFLFLIDGYYSRYELKDWALARLAALPKKFDDCTECGECLEKCPYGLPIPDMMKDAAKRVV
jgi:predicted aldo/keto reductase-like oxidoreductase